MTYNKPYDLSIPDSYPDKHIMNYQSINRKTDKYIFMKGVHLPCPDMKNGASKTSTDPKDYDLIFHSEISPDRLLKYGYLETDAASTFLLRKDLVDLLKAFCPNDFQAFPATIVADKPKKTGEFECKDFYLINITHLEDVFDHEKCEFHISKSEPIMIMGTRRMILQDASCLNGHHIVREKTLKSHIFVSPEFVALFKKHKVKGCAFYKDAQGKEEERAEKAARG
ncbi:MAG TPA: DUF1629 domain-containing protein [Alphaproteobacteria bacterium]|nr:DUF1629 domain-containing protein [Alphaproteobacteria bacterium]